MTNAMTRLTRIKKNKLLKIRRWEHAAGLTENHFFFLEHPLDDNGEITTGPSKMTYVYNGIRVK